MENWEQALSARSDLEVYGDNALGLFALALRYQVDDLHSIAAEALTDGSDDKKCDILHIDLEEELAIVAQCYMCSKQKPSAPANKASDLNTAVGWLLQRPLKDLPVRLRQLATELRNAIKDDQIRHLQFWYVHNLPESQNVENELKTVEASAKAASASFPNSGKLQISAQEIGNARLSEWYSDTLSPILVSDKIDIEVEGGFEIKGNNWRAYVAPIPARTLSTLYRKHKAKLFSANVRDYLGSRRSDANINNGIKKSAESSPGDFWVYNNGITVLVNDYKLIEKKKKKILHIKGISIVNGAQTTGAIGSLKKSPDPKVMVPARFVQAPDQELVRNVIQFNNSQNKITASDFRSTDRIQKKLKEQISQIPDAEYEGGRRGGHSDVITRNKKLLPSYTVAQALAAFHGDPVVAYNQKTNIWVSDRLYARYFPEDITGSHVVFAYSLLRAVEEGKKGLVVKYKSKPNSLTTQEETLLEYFRYRGSTYLLVSAIAGSLESILGHKISNRFKISFGDKTSPMKGKDYWVPIVEVTSPFTTQLLDAFSDGLKNNEKVNNAQNIFKSLVQATSGANSTIFEKFKKRVSTGRK